MNTMPLPTESPAVLVPPALPASLPAEKAVTVPPKQPRVQVAKEQRFVFYDADWRMYEAFLQGLGKRHIRCTYDRGRLEIMTVSLDHERASNLLGRLVETLTLELRSPLLAGGSTTFRRQDLDRGLEPDQCYYLQNAPLIRGKKEVNLNIDPPPDLVIEIAISRSSLDRLGIYAALGVAEAWLFDGEFLTVFVQDANKEYQPSDTSGHFPFLPLKEVATFLNRRNDMDDNELVFAFQTWLREQIAHNWQQPT